MQRANLQQRGRNLYYKIIRSMDTYSFERGLEHSEDEFLGFNSYKDFQLDFINKLTEGQMDTFDFLSGIEPHIRILEEESEIDVPMSGFCINSDGKIVIISPR